MSVDQLYSPKLLADLAQSGILPGEIRAKTLTPAEKAATGAPVGSDGYAIPYFSLRGTPLPFYRVKLFDVEDDDAKYRQVIGSLNHVYFPPRLWGLINELASRGELEYLLVTEGEKKAVAAVKNGFPCCSLSGVDSWRNRTISLPRDTKLASVNGQLKAKLPGNKRPVELASTLAEGLEDVINYIRQADIPIVLVYDTDGPRAKEPVARAAAMFAFELRRRGIPLAQIRQCHLPPLLAGKAPPTHQGLKTFFYKTGLDDYLLHEDGGPEKLRELVRGCIADRTAFPRYPNISAYINERLQRGNSLTRQDQQSVALAVLTDLDARGQRLRAPDEGQLYYYQAEEKRLLKVIFPHPKEPGYADSPWGILLFKEYNLHQGDVRTLTWLAGQFSAEQPIEEVVPERILAWRGDTFYYHLNDGQQVRVTKDHIAILNNGDDNVLFEAGHVQGITEEEFREALKTQTNDVGDSGRPLPNRWYDVLRGARIQESSGDHQRLLLSYLYYISPWFYRWRETQLPVEIVTGEAGSGKSSLYVIRLNILTGSAVLRNTPNDLRDWQAGVANSGGLYVTDNVQLQDAQLRQKLSDELCRLTTEPAPNIEQRRLYTNTGVVKIHVSCVFGITSIRQPFTNADIVQRSIITELDKGTDELEYDGEWASHQLARFGGRANWLAHHILFVHRLLRSAFNHEKWATRYKAKYRLINVEQLLTLTAQIFGAAPSDAGWVKDYLESSRDERLSEADWALEGLVAFVAEMEEQNGAGVYSQEWAAIEISTWASGEEEFANCKVLQEPRSLGRYLQLNKHTVASTAGLVPGRTLHNKQMYKLVKK
jgi:hypothetical protein